MFRPAHSTSIGRPTARRTSASRSMVSGVCLPSVSSTMMRHSAFAGSTIRMFAHKPSRSMARKNVPGSLPQSLQQVGRAEEQAERMAEHALAGVPDAERVAHHAVGAVAGDEIVRGHALARAAVEIDELGGDAVALVLERFEPRPIAQAHGRARLREVAQHRVEPHLRARLQPLRAVGSRAAARSAAAAACGRARSRQGW